jgi:DNA-binding transcriptional MerR regulator
MKMQKRKFRIGELAQLLNVERFVIRFWEKEFLMKANRSDGGQRFYDEKDFEKFKQIKELLYDRGFTISGARKQLKSKTSQNTLVIASHKTTLEADESIDMIDKSTIQERILTLQQQLIKLRELL